LKQVGTDLIGGVKSKAHVPPRCECNYMYKIRSQGKENISVGDRWTIPVKLACFGLLCLLGCLHVPPALSTRTRNVVIGAGPAGLRRLNFSWRRKCQDRCRDPVGTGWRRRGKYGKCQATLSVIYIRIPGPDWWPVHPVVACRFVARPMHVLSR